MNGKHYYTLNEQKELIEYLCFGSAARLPGGYSQGIYSNYDYLDIGLGLKPELTGRGLGLECTRTVWQPRNVFNFSGPMQMIMVPVCAN